MIKLILLNLIFFLILSKEGFASDRVNSPIYDTFESLLKKFKEDAKSFKGNLSNSILLNIDIEGEINSSFKKHMRKSFESLNLKKSLFKFKYCQVCSIMRGDTIGNQVYLKKDLKDLKEIKVITKKRVSNPMLKLLSLEIYFL